ncbi:DNA-packaging protein [Clostridium beijerinckii]|uniref:DNA-packaging protein n=1 Tax=Clostridium beijerinckii TaxID=1520 RepID=UPI00156D9800|nr:DNA-packaging protein [Clostridium beijerinckii]NRU52553.1 hypothetical protein [Clostridium beijerinckii]NYC69270.1 hypothetical protein [Clostridium beijerinckii]NYC91754.1 hypothetical protein [Clostridium beijerinckii]
MASITNFKSEKDNKKEGILDIHNPAGNSFEKDVNPMASTFDVVKKDFAKYVSLWRACPDLFIDFITPKDSKFKLFFYQRVFLRSAIRHKYFYATFTRAFSKSFLSILILYIKLILYPNISLFICSGGKGQATNIAKEKIEEIWEKFPILKREVKDYQVSKDYLKVTLQNNSRLDIVAVRESTRGGRRNAGLIEEAILVDGKLLNEVIIPLMNVNRRAKNGDVDPNEPHKQQIYVTTAGYRNTFAYDKLKQILVWMATKDDEAFVMGGSWRIPVLHKLLDPNFVEELKEDGTYNPLSFDREYESIWTGSGEDSFFNEDMITKNRVLKKSEDKPDFKVSDNDKFEIKYIVSTDVARSEGNQNANTVVTVGKVKQNLTNGHCVTNIVNMFVLHGEHFEEQAIKIKKIVFKYKAEMCPCDLNGLGAGLADYLVKENIDENGEIFPPFSIVNDDRFDKYKTDDSLPLLYAIRSQGIAGQIHVNCLSQISSNKVKFLIDEMEAKTQLSKTQIKDMSGREMGEYLAPFLNTTCLKDEMLNLRAKQTGKDVVLDRINKGIQKDRFSSLEYLLWYVKEIENNFEDDSDDDDRQYVFW